MTRGTLRYCPECRQAWPRGAEFDLRSFRWLDDLPRAVSPSNIDCVIHDGAGGRDRFLVLETKRPSEAIEPGQAWLLRALAGVNPERVFVRLLVGSVGELHVHRVDRDSIEDSGYTTTAPAFRVAVASFLGGARWRDAEAPLANTHRPAQPARVAFGPCLAVTPDGNGECYEPSGHVGPHKTKDMSDIWPKVAA